MAKRCIFAANYDVKILNIKPMKVYSDFDLNGKVVLVRVDFNVPIKDGKVGDDSRIKAHLGTIEALLDQGARPVLMSHLGRPKGEKKAEFSLKPVAEYLNNLISAKVVFAEDCIGQKALQAAQSLKMDEVLVLENLRFYNEETNGDAAFAERLAELGDFYINDAFGTAHRAHASTAIIAQYFEGARAFGLVMAREIENINKVLFSKEKPVTAIVGGAKVSSKIGVIEHLLSKVNNLVIGGGMAHTFNKAQGAKVGKSLVENDYLELAQRIMKEAAEKGVEILLPTDSLNASDFSNEALTGVSAASAIPENEMGLDIGPDSKAALREVLLRSKVIIWNGPMGVFEMDNFAGGTEATAKILAEATKMGAFTLVGGGDSVAAINKFNLSEEVSYVSTGGGAMLEYMEGKELPGIQAING